MKQFFTLKFFFVLFALLTGVGSAGAQEDYDYEWVKPSKLSDLSDGDMVVIADASLNLALPNNDDFFRGVGVTIRGNSKITSNVDKDIQ